MEDVVKDVVLQRSKKFGFGFSIIGGAGSFLPPIVCEIVEGSPADKSDQLEAGDVLLAVNDVDVTNCTTKQVLNALRLSGPQLTLRLKQDVAVKQRAERYLYCSPEDSDTLRDVISHNDLTGVDELIVKRQGSPRLNPKHLASDDNMPRRMGEDGGPGGKHHHPGSRIPGPKSGIPPPKTGRFHNKNMENGFEKKDTPKTSSPSGIAKPPGSAESRRFETFVMTGDMIIQTTSPHHKPEMSYQSDKRTKESPVTSKKEYKSNIATASPKGSPKKAATQKIPNSPRASPKRAPSPAEQESPKSSPKKDNKKSPVKQSRLPRLNTPKSSPKLSPKISPKKSATPENELMDYSDEQICVDVTNGNAKNSSYSDPYSRVPHSDMRPYELELLGFSRFPDVPVELDIPPDDICSDDEKYKHEEVVDADDLPPPPDEFFHLDTGLIIQNQEPFPPAPNLPPDLPPPVLCPSDLDPPDPAPPDFGPAALGAPDLGQPDFGQPDLGQPDLGPPDLGLPDLGAPFLPDLVDVEKPNGAEFVYIDRMSPVREEEAMCVQIEDLPPPPMSPVHVCGTVPGVTQVSDRTEPQNFSLCEVSQEPSIGPGGDSVEQVSVSQPLPQPPPAHNRSASMGDSSSVESNDMFSSDSKLEQAEYRNTPVRSIVVSKSAEKIAPGKAASSTKTVSNSMQVRSSKSQENYLECNDMVTLVDIDLDDNLASSVDALHYEKSSTSLDSLGYVQFHDNVRSLDNSPDKRTEKVRNERVFMPAFISLEEPSSVTKIKEGAKPRDFSKSDRSSPSKSDKTSPSRTSPSKSRSSREKSDDSKTPHSKASAIPIPHASRKPPKPPVRSASNAKSPVSQPIHEVPPTSEDQEVAEIAGMLSPADTIIEAPLNTATSHQVDSDLPSESEPPIATSSAPPSPDATAFANTESDSSSTPGSPEKDAGSIYHQPLKEIDRPSASRLAKRLFNLEGFKKGDVTRHLSKKNDFSYLVGEEFLKHFDFTGQTLDEALRGFLKNLVLAGETQERERVLAHFSRRYLETNPGNYNSEDSCHTLVCALMLLNTDLHGQNIGRKMTVNEFIENLSDLNDGDNFPREVLKNLHHSIREEPLECHFEDELSDSDTGSQGPRQMLQEQQRYLSHNPFLDIPDPSKATEYKKGYVMRKCCVEPDGRKTPVGKRGWKMYFATLRDMVLYLHKDDHGFKKNSMVANATNAIRVHHALAFKASDYKKKHHVFRLQTSDWAQYLFQTSNSKECQEWIDTINFVSASLSAPPLPGAVGSQRKFQRPLLPASYTRLNMREQASHHEQKLAQLELELSEHRTYPPEKGAKSRHIQEYVEKETYLQFEVKRFKVYSALLQMKLATFPELEPSLVEMAIGEVEEPTSLPSSPEQPRVAIPIQEPDSASTEVLQRTRAPQRVNHPVQRSMSDRQGPDLITTVNPPVMDHSPPPSPTRQPSPPNDLRSPIPTPTKSPKRERFQSPPRCDLLPQVQDRTDAQTSRLSQRSSQVVSPRYAVRQSPTRVINPGYVYLQSSGTRMSAAYETQV